MSESPADRFGGVDFSGTLRPAATWAALGSAVAGGLQIDSLDPIGRAGVGPLLAGQPGVIWGLDFPFGLPIEFLDFLAQLHHAPTTTWAAFAAWLPTLPYPDFLAARDAFCRDRREPRRQTDWLVPGAASALHKVNPNLMPMTYHGVGLLGTLAGAIGISPFAGNHPATVHETYPGGTLRTLGLMVRGYKSGPAAPAARAKIVAALVAWPILPIRLTPDQSAAAIADDNALDAVAACLTAALLSYRPSWFQPPPEEPADWRREGWIWLPRPGHDFD